VTVEKQYAAGSTYEKKLAAVMKRLKAQEHDWNYDRHGAWVQFRYRGQLYRFDHSVQNARARGVKLDFGSDAFAQIVLSLEDLARMVERGIYDLQTWVSGMKMLPAALEVPSFLKLLGFAEIPADVEEVKTRYRNLALKFHPDQGGNAEDFDMLKRASEQAMQYMALRNS
jgi:hypothetical protein